VAFKGGSEPGVLAMSWYLERESDHRAFVLALGVSGDQSINELRVFDIAKSGVDLLARFSRS
jgi:hypothetical protein